MNKAVIYISGTTNETVNNMIVLVKIPRRV